MELIDDGDRLGVAVPTGDGGTELLYLVKDLDKRLLRFLDEPGQIPSDPVLLDLIPHARREVAER
jgi:hypothetical protein